MALKMGQGAGKRAESGGNLCASGAHVGNVRAALQSKLYLTYFIMFCNTSVYPNPINSCVYLCMKATPSSAFICRRFDTYYDADKYYYEACKNIYVDTSLMVPACKYVPQLAVNYVLHYKPSQFLIRVPTQSS